MDTSFDRILVTVGGQQALDVVAKVLLNPGDPIVVEAPSYVGALSAFAAYEPRFVTVPLDADGMDVEALSEVLDTGTRPKFVYTVPNFSNPAGVTLSLTRRERLVELCRRAGVPIIEDNPYGMLRFEGDHLPCLHTLDPQNVIYVGTLSKVFAPGMRVGWVVAPPGLLERLVLAKEAADLCSGSFSQLVAKAYLDGPRFRPNLAAFVDLYRRRRDAMLGALSEHFPPESSWTQPKGGFYVWATLPQWADTGGLLPQAVRRRVAFVPGTAFYPDGRGANQMRLAFCHPPEEAIGEGVKRLGGLLEDSAPRPRRPGSTPTPAGG
jgi:2-aminoadipate transaminase